MIPIQQLLSQTTNNSSKIKISNIKESIKDKLKANWKGIYRYLSSKEKGNSGIVSVKVFNDALNSTNTFLSRQELDNVVKYFSGKGKTAYEDSQLFST